MVYTVGEAAKRLGISPSTLRYYDKEGLLPFVERSSGGIRMFQESDFEWLQVIECMKKAGMSIKAIRDYIEMALQGDSTIDARLELFRRQQKEVEQQMVELQHTMEMLRYKCWYYETAKATGTIDVPKHMPDKDVPAEFQAIRKSLRRVPNQED
jgi:DNA-binding transcriptional MerR regulator